MAKKRRKRRRSRVTPAPSPVVPPAPVGFGEGITELPVQRGPGYSRIGGQTIARGPLPTAGAATAATAATGTAGAISGAQAAAAEESITSLLETYTGKGWPTTSERVRRMFKKAGLIESLDEIDAKVAGGAAKRFKGLAASARSGNSAKTTLGAIIESVTGLRTKGAGINAAVAEAMGLKGLLRRAAGTTVGKGVLGLGALAAFEAPEFAGGLLESGREVAAIDEALASAERGDPGSLLPTVQDLVDQEKLQYLRQRNMARVLAASGASPSQLSGTLPLPSDRSAQVPTTVSIPGSAGFPG